MSGKNVFINQLIKLENGNAHYLSISEFICFINCLKQKSPFIKNISFNPFYKHKDFQLEIDERILFIEIREEINTADIKSFYDSLLCDEAYYNLDLEKRCFLVQKNDLEGYKRTLDCIISYLDVLIPYIYEKIKKEYNLIESDLLFGNVCFEVYYES